MEIGTKWQLLGWAATVAIAGCAELLPQAVEVCARHCSTGLKQVSAGVCTCQDWEVKRIVTTSVNANAPPSPVQDVVPRGVVEPKRPSVLRTPWSEPIE